MVKRDKGKWAKCEIEEKESGSLDPKPVVELSSSDDDEANEDLSLKIVEKALLVKAAKLNERNDAVPVDGDVVSVVDLTTSSLEAEADVGGTSGSAEETDLDLKSKKIVKRRKKKTKIEKQVIMAEDGDRFETIEKVETVEEAEVAEAAKAEEKVESFDTKTKDISDNIVLRKLLRGPRYFDPPDRSWETCYNCGEEGHMAVNCNSASKRKKPCFLCGSLDHAVRQCSKVQNCYICKMSDHRAKDCPDKHKSGSKDDKICLRCGDSGHDMFSCRKEYSCDDLKEIQCYICKNFGHLCCLNFVDTSAREVSCYRCGQLGHTGLSCSKSIGETKDGCYKCGEGHFAHKCTSAKSCSKSCGETKDRCYKCGEEGHFARECSSAKSCSKSRGETKNGCYKCGEEGHFARECSSGKVVKRNREPSTPTVKPRRENKEFLRYNSAPHDHSKRRKNIQYEEEGLSTPREIRKRGSWIFEDSEEFSRRRSKRNHWNCPSTPGREVRRKSSLNSGSGRSGSQSSKQKSSHRCSASRFGNNEPSRPYYNGW